MKTNGKSNLCSNGLFTKLASQATNKDYENGEAIFLQGDAADSMFRIEHGHVKLSVASKRRKKAAIAILGAGDCFGEGCLETNSLRTSTATSIKDSKIGRISRKAMLRRIKDEPSFAKLFTSHLLFRIGKVEDNLADQLLNTSERRLARLLLQLSDFGQVSGHASPVLNIDQGTLAQVVGTTRSRVSHFMNRFRKKGFINYNGSLHVDKALLTYLSHEQRPTNGKKQLRKTSLSK